MSLLLEVSKSKEYHAEPWFSRPVFHFGKFYVCLDILLPKCHYIFLIQIPQSISLWDYHTIF
jgi:hypothetical protein